MALIGDQRTRADVASECLDCANIRQAMHTALRPVLEIPSATFAKCCPTNAASRAANRATTRAAPRRSDLSLAADWMRTSRDPDHRAASHPPDYLANRGRTKRGARMIGGAKRAG